MNIRKFNQEIFTDLKKFISILDKLLKGKDFQELQELAKFLLKNVSTLSANRVASTTQFALLTKSLNYCIAIQLADMESVDQSFQAHIKEIREHFSILYKFAAMDANTVVIRQYERAHISRAVPTLNIYIDPGTAPDEKIVAYLSKLNRLYQLMGGSGLAFSQDNIKVYNTETA